MRTNLKDLIIVIVCIVMLVTLVIGLLYKISTDINEEASHYVVTTSDGKILHQDVKIYVGARSEVLYVTDEEGNEFTYPSNWKAYKRVKREIR